MAILSRLAPLVLALPYALAAANNWEAPCFDGKCAYDVAQSGPHGLTTGSLLIVRHIQRISCKLLTAAVFQAGSTKAISDITPAAGWTILDCDAGKTAQTIRAVCTGASSDCSHLYQGGAAGTIVRLPESVRNSVKVLDDGCD